MDKEKFSVKLKRVNIEIYINSSEKVEINEDFPLKFKKKADFFITLKKVTDFGKELRGCIGYPLPSLPLIDAVIESSISSVTKDTRFSQVGSLLDKF